MIPELQRRPLGPWIDELSRLSASELRPTELTLYRERARGISEADVIRRFFADRLFTPSSVDQRQMHALETRAFACLPAGYRAVALSPVLPLGAAHVLAATPQDNVLSATRSAEVMGDPTLAFALLAAREDEARLATACRVVRMQKLQEAHHVRHFRLFALATSGRDRGSEQFVCEALREHIGFYLSLLGDSAGSLAVRITDTEGVRHLAAEQGIDLAETRWDQASIDLPRRATLAELEGLGLGCTVLRRLERIREGVIAPLSARFPEVDFCFDPGRTRQATYYAPLCFHVDADGFPWGKTPIADGGLVDWTQRLAENRKLRMLTSGIGTELLAQLPRAQP